MMSILIAGLLALQEEIKDKALHYTVKIPFGWKSSEDVPEYMKTTIERMIGNTKARILKPDQSKLIVVIGARALEKDQIQTFAEFKTWCKSVADSIPQDYPGARISSQGLKRYGKVQAYYVRFQVKGNEKSSHSDEVRMFFTRTRIYFTQAVWSSGSEVPSEVADVVESLKLDVEDAQLELKKASKELGARVQERAFEFSMQIPQQWIRATGGERTALKFTTTGCAIEVESEESTDSLRDVVASWRRALEKAGEAKNFTEGQDFLIDGQGGHQIIYTSTAGDRRMRVLRTTLRAGGRAYHIICSAPDDEYEFYEDCFKAVTSSWKYVEK